MFIFEVAVLLITMIFLLLGKFAKNDKSIFPLETIILVVCTDEQSYLKANFL